jgi:hypothetical protein
LTVVLSFLTLTLQIGNGGIIEASKFTSLENGEGAIQNDLGILDAAGLVIGGMLIIAILTRRGRPRHKAVPVLPRLRSALGISLAVFCGTPATLTMCRGALLMPLETTPADFEEKLEERNGVTVPKNDDSPNS